ncbi:MAG: tRNA (cytidine(34)-2'-O)-methyltransferase [Bdellovibrionales bacterium]|nr:tRNA (cytidine(34)-2'-O)-methyltransferase [Bdellovibrionales bacterium]
MKFHVVLVHPEIPSNTGNIGRLCVNTNAHLHLIEPLGFDLSDKQLKRAGLDYWTHLQYTIYKDYKEWEQKFSGFSRYFFSTKAKRNLYDHQFQDQDCLVFGSETKGLGQKILDSNSKHCFKIPMSESARSLNLSNAVAIVLYEAIRQHSYSIKS